MKLFVRICNYNKYRFPDIFYIETEDVEKNRNICVETDLFKISNKYCVMLDCREVYHEEDILNVKYLKATYKE